MKKFIKFWLLLILSFISINVYAYDITSNNNPGNVTNSGGGTISGGTLWPDPYLKVVRIRIFRDGKAIKTGYYSLANKKGNCSGGVNDVTLCQTSGYDYGSISSANDLSCSSGQSIKFGCLVSSSLESTFSASKANGTHLEKYFTKSSYKQLKSVLKGMGYDDSNYNNEDIVIVEPATLVTCNNKYYFGTSTALMSKNVSYTGPSGNACAASESKWPGYTFVNLFKNMSVALKVSTSSFSDSSYSGFGYFKYDVSGLGYPSGSITVTKIDKDTKAKLQGAEITLYKGTGCSSNNKIKSLTTDASGVAKFDKLNITTYSYKETKAPAGYKLNNACTAVTLENKATKKNIKKTLKNTKIDQNGDLDVYIKNKETNALITSSNGTYNIYSGANCTGKVVYENQDTKKTGKVSIKNLKPGTYSIKEVKAPEGYVANTDKCVKKNVTITANKTTDETIYYIPSCEVKLAASNKSVSSLLALYNEYKFNGLLNFGSPSCKNVCQDKKGNDENGSVITGCLSGKREYTFNEWNLSCFDDTYQDPTGMYVAFCQDKFNLNNSLGINKFYSKSGEFFIQKINKDNKNYMQIFNDKYVPVLKEGNYIAHATSDRVCYIYNRTTTPSLSKDTDLVEVYFGDNNSDSNADKLNAEVSSAQTYNGWVGNGFYKVQNTTTYNFALPTLYLKKLTGKVSEVKVSSSTKVEGVISTFNSTEEGNVLYKLKLGNNEYSSNACTYKSEKEIITYEGEDDPGNMELEFRTIDAKKPFNGRETNSNWCDKDDCSSDNNLVVTYIKNRVDSYGNNGTAKPKYKITLYPQDIQVIRNYNTDNMYDEYIEYCDKDDVCRNAFVHDLKNGTLYQYKNNVIKKSYGNLTNKLILGSN